jgi:hypothetical protein
MKSTVKTCSYCKQAKSLESFHRKAHYADGSPRFHSQCITCTNQRRSKNNLIKKKQESDRQKGSKTQLHHIQIFFKDLDEKILKQYFSDYIEAIYDVIYQTC